MAKKLSVLLALLFLLTGFSQLTFGEEIKLPEKKQTTLGLYVTAKEAFVKWHTDSKNVNILDCRTPEEYIFVGHAPMARNIPSHFVTHKFNAEKKEPVMEGNPAFVSMVEAKYKKDAIILIMCRSGGRSAKSVNQLAEAGFKNVYSITDGFEGDKVKDPLSYFNGKRFKNGWKNSGNPWTYALDPTLMYTSDKMNK